MSHSAGDKQLKGRFNMFRLSDGRIWMLTMGGDWSGSSGSHIIQDGMVWTGFGHPFGSKPFNKFSIVQLDTEEDKDKFIVSGGFVDSAPSLKTYSFDAKVWTQQIV